MLTQHINLLQSTMSFFKSFFSVPFLVQFRDYSWLVRRLAVRCYLKKACLITLKGIQSQNWPHSEAYYKHTQIHFRNSQIKKNYISMMFLQLENSIIWKLSSIKKTNDKHASGSKAKTGCVSICKSKVLLIFMLLV